jgi:hypothetical protein
MQNDKDNNSGHAQNGERGIFGSLILLTLPWLSLQRDILGVIKKGLEEHKKEDIYFKPIQHLVHELHALMMVLDRSRKLRSHFDDDLEKKLVDEFTQLFKKVVAGSVNFIEVQEIILAGISDVLSKLKDGNKPTKSHTTTN